MILTIWHDFLFLLLRILLITRILILRRERRSTSWLIFWHWFLYYSWCLYNFIKYHSTMFLFNVGKYGGIAKIGLPTGTFKIPIYLLCCRLGLRAIHIIDYEPAITCFNLIIQLVNTNKRTNYIFPLTDIQPEK